LAGFCQKVALCTIFEQGWFTQESTD